MSRRSETETDLCCPDVVGIEGNLLAATKDMRTGLVMNCACHGQVTLNELVQQINILLNKNLEPIYAEPRPGDIKHSFADIELIHKMIKYKPTVNFESGLSKLMNNTTNS